VQSEALPKKDFPSGLCHFGHSGLGGGESPRLSLITASWIASNCRWTLIVSTVDSLPRKNAAIEPARVVMNATPHSISTRAISRPSNVSGPLPLTLAPTVVTVAHQMPERVSVPPAALGSTVTISAPPRMIATMTRPAT